MNTATSRMATIAKTWLATLAIIIFATACKPGNHAQPPKSTSGTDTFQRIDAKGEIHVTYTQAAEHGYTIEAPQIALKYLRIEVANNKLNITSKDAPDSLMDSVTIHVTAPLINEIDLNGSCTFTSREAINADKIVFSISGSGSINLSKALTCHELKAGIDGSGSIMFTEVKAKEVETEINGSGSISYQMLTADQATSEINGSGSIVLKGNAARHTENVNGNGTIDTTGLK
ncbi:MAG: DUF2807 domain-containing protein [Muribaculaceae bacterium]|nr:DUF2807 domain-containing protein [Muribaculaceae bacterium]